MASINGVSSNNMTSSLFNSGRIISGLASGLDTEGMIEGLVQSYQTKINQLNQQATKLEWKQDAYRSIIQKMVGFSNKYTSYTSNTNLTSPSFFSNAVKVLTKGEFKDSVTASGKTSSDIRLDAVHQLATSAQYRTKSNFSTGSSQYITGGQTDLFQEGGIELGNLSGSLTLTYGSKNVSISFNETSDVQAMKDLRAKLAREKGVSEDQVGDADVLAGLINQKLADEKIVFNSGSSESADKRIQAVANPNGTIQFNELGTAKNGIYISGATGNLAKQLGIDEEALKDAKESKITSINAGNIQSEDGKKGLIRSLSSIDRLAELSKDGGVKMNINLDGSTKQIAMPHVAVKKKDGGDEYYLNGKKVDKADFAQKYTEALQESVKGAFGDKISVENKGENGELKLEFKMKNEGSELVINTSAGDALGIGSAATSYLNTSKTLKDLMGDKLDGLTPVYEKDDEGNIKTNYDGTPIPKLDDKGKQQYEFILNGEKIGTYTEDTQLSKILSDINANEKAGVTAAYSRTTQSFTFTAKETGADSKVEMGEGLAQAMFGSTEEKDVSGSKSFTEAYGINWLKPGESERITVGAPGGRYTFNVAKEATISDVVDELNDAFQHQYSFSYDKYTGRIEATDLQAGGPVAFTITDSYGDAVQYDESAAPPPKTSSYTAGQDAMFTVTVNGEQKNMVRSSNNVNVDGLTISMNETFNSKAVSGGYGFEVADSKKSVTFQNKTDSDKIIDAVKSMAEEYNAMMSEIKKTYGTMPYRNSSGAFAGYEPLTDDDRAGMSDSAIERYEEKAKQGILFGDRNLSNLYSKMSQVFNFNNTKDVDTLRQMGLELTFDSTDGSQSLKVDEEKLRAMLDSDPERVGELFTKTDGIMDRMKTHLDNYSRTNGEPKGILVQQSGTPLSSLSLLNNGWQKEIDKINTDIEKWQNKLTAQVERYTSQFSRLEQLISQMNSQSSTLMGLMGG